MSKRTTEFGEMPNVFMEYMGKTPRTKIKGVDLQRKNPKLN